MHVFNPQGSQGTCLRYRNFFVLYLSFIVLHLHNSPGIINIISCEILAFTMASMKMAASWGNTPCSLIEDADFSELRAATINRAMRIIDKNSRCNIPESCYYFTFYFQDDWSLVATWFTEILLRFGPHNALHTTRSLYLGPVLTQCNPLARCPKAIKCCRYMPRSL